MRTTTLLIAMLFFVALPYSTFARSSSPRGPRHVGPVKGVLTKTTAFLKAGHRRTVNLAREIGREGKAARRVATTVSLLGIAGTAAALGFNAHEMEPATLAQVAGLLSVGAVIAPAAPAYHGWHADGSPRAGLGARIARGVTHAFGLVGDPAVMLSTAVAKPVEKLLPKNRK